MPAEPAKRKAIYEDLYSVPDNMTGQIIDGELYVTPRPSREHVNASTILGARLIPPFRFGEGGGPGGWIILVEPEIKLGANILVPDLAGWRKERFPVKEESNWISVAPDWICEILSPGSSGYDRVKKMRIYAEHGVLHFWLIDPGERTLEVFRLESSGSWLMVNGFSEEERVRVEPFGEIEIDLKNLWLE